MSVLIAMYGATVGQYAITSKPMTCNQAICALLPNENYPYTYLFMVAKNKKEELINNAVGSAQQNISQVIINKIKFLVPKKELVVEEFFVNDRNQYEFIDKKIDDDLKSKTGIISEKLETTLNNKGYFDDDIERLDEYDILHTNLCISYVAKLFPIHNHDIE